MSKVQTEDIKILKIDPFREIGTASELIGEFGGRAAYLKSIQELEEQLYG
ncbi:hypothetical protein FEMY_23690 [Ferrovum myxofaciens]|uniref:EcoEI R protein C-terminal domain-containing protein n=1 Tax=Ferrovum myxofaciens TaxID=416213 RepID=A0A149VV62_9PROT|nr:type I restriction-modification enzyme R subunit C-terminal domain-containing protein [Ferrovum myxofaciens]KXW57113.1 hypothetical protein FEMY_23690 [Ferrovum myxofaciens]